MIYLYIATAAVLLLSFTIDFDKSVDAVKKAVRMFVDILPPFLLMLMLISIILFFLPDAVIAEYLGRKGKFISLLPAIFIGSIAIIPGFIAYPLCGILLEEGVSYMVLSAFSTTLMMVGVLTFPIEKKYFGIKVAIIRNATALIIAFLTAIITGIVFGEVF